MRDRKPLVYLWEAAGFFKLLLHGCNASGLQIPFSGARRKALEGKGD